MMDILYRRLRFDWLAHRTTKKRTLHGIDYEGMLEDQRVPRLGFGASH